MRTPRAFAACERRTRGVACSRMGAVENRLEALRVAAGMTQRELADHLGVDRSMVSCWESLRYAIPDKHKPTIAGLFGVSVTHLMCWDVAA